MTNRLQTLAEIEAAVWAELQQAAHDSHHEWRTPVLATAGEGPDGEPAGDARTVVLREVDTDARLLVTYTDSRAAKAGQLKARPTATLLMWSKRLSWQVRCRAVCEVVDDGLAVSSRWARIRLSPAAAQDYLSPQPPGAELRASATPPQSPTPALALRECFAIVNARVTTLDWLELHRDGHRRALFGDGAARWLQP